MVDVAHDGDHGRARQEVLGVVVEGEGVLLLFAHDLDLAAQVIGDELDEVVGHALGEREGVAKQEEALDDVGRGHVEELGELGHRGARGDLDHADLGHVLVVGDGLLDRLLLGGLRLLLLTALLALLAATLALALGLVHARTRLLEDALAVVFLGGLGHAAVAVLALLAVVGAMLAAGGLLGLLRARGAGRDALGGRRRLLARALAARAGALGALLAGALATVALALGLGLLGGGLLALGLQDLLLLGDLVEQARHGGDGLGRVVVNAVPLLFLLAPALGLDALCLGLLARSLLCGALGGLLGALGLATLLGLDALLLGLCLGLSLGLCLCLLLGLLLGLDLGGAGLENGGHLLADERDVDVLEGTRGRLGRNLHVGKVVEHLLACHAKLLGKVMYAGLCHVSPFRAGVDGAGRARRTR